MSQTVSTLYLEVAASHASPEPRLVLGCVAFGTLATALSAFLAARQAASIRPAESLRAPGPPPPAAAPRGGSIRDLCGAALLAIALPALRLYPHWGRPAIWVALAALVVGGCLVVSRIVLAVHATVGRALGQRLGVAARMASENLPRDLTRTSVTSGALMVSLGMAAGFAVLVSSFVGTVSDWVERSIMADIFVTSTTPGFMRNVAMSSALGDELAAIPGTGVVERVRLADLELRGRQVRVEAYDILDAAKGAHEDAVEGTYEQIAREVHEGTSVAVSENLSRKFGIHLGDRIDLQGKDGPLSFRVAGVLVDYASDLGTIMMDRAAYARGWGDDLVDMYKIHVKPGADVEGIRRLINEREGSRFDLVVLTGEEWKAHVLGQLRRVFALIRALEGVALVVAGFGICNALSANVLDRVRELGVLRAVGLLRSQVRRMVVAEATLVGLAGVVAGLPLGVAIGRVLVFSVDSAELTGWSVRFAPAWTNLAELALLGVAISAASGWYPARAAASLQVTGALAYE
jgi:putative ABC transport system permease protein